MSDLYVALTRATRRLGVVHTEPLPKEMEGLRARRRRAATPVGAAPWKPRPHGAARPAEGPVAPAGAGQEAAEPQAGEVGRRHRHVAALQFLGQRLPGAAGQRRVDVDDRLPVVLHEFDRAVDDVAEEQRPFGAVGDDDHRRPGRVAGGVADGDPGRHRGVVAEGLEPVGQRRQLADRARLRVRAGDEVVPVGGVAAERRPGEHHGALLGGPADVVEVEVGEHHVGHVVEPRLRDRPGSRGTARRGTCRCRSVRRRRRRGRPGRRSAPGSPPSESSMLPSAVEELLVGQPGIVPAAGEAQEVGGGQPGPAVEDGKDLEVADSHGRRQYRSRSCLPGRFRPSERSPSAPGTFGAPL